MRKVLCLILLVGLLASVSTAFAEEPRVRFYTPSQTTKDITVYAFYDTDTSVFCYVTNMGGIHCFRAGEINMKRINELQKINEKNFKQLNEPIRRIIKLP